MCDKIISSTKPLVYLSLLFLLLSAVQCAPSAKMKLEPGGQEFYQTARLIMSKQEREIFRHLPDRESRQEFIEDFWAKRDPNPETEENEFKVEFFRRVEYANERFREGMPGWKTDRGRIYIYFGEPDRRDQHPFVDNPSLRGYKGYILWMYYRYGLAVRFLDKRGDGSYTIDTDPYTGGIYGSLFEAMRRARFGLIYTDDLMQKKFMNFGLDYDSDTKEATISIPVKTLTFVEEDGLLKADFDFIFYVYRRNTGEKQVFSETRHFEATEEEVLELRNVVFDFSFKDLKPGRYYFDVIIVGKPETAKARKIFKIKS